MKKPVKILLIVLCAFVFTAAAAVFAVCLRLSDPGARVVFLSPSTQGANLYADGVTTERENMNLLADLVQARLEARGFTVYRSDPDKTFREAVDASNALAPSVHAALHTNAVSGENRGVRGCEVYVRRHDYRSLRLASCLYESVSAATPTEDRGIKYTDTLSEVTDTASPCVLVELDFHDSPEGAAFLTGNREALADAVADGISRFFEASVSWKLLLRSLLR